jgi:hypothetical protein
MRLWTDSRYVAIKFLESAGHSSSSGSASRSPKSDQTGCYVEITLGGLPRGVGACSEPYPFAYRIGLGA